MTPEDRKLLASVAEGLQTLAEAVKTLAANAGQDQMRDKAKFVAENIADANLTWEVDS